jgi:CRP-like cAMP-binding protein
MFSQPTPRVAMIGWTVVFAGINLVQILRLLHERRPVRLDPDEQRLYTQTFRTLTPREYKRLLGVGRWEEAAAGQVLIPEGVAAERVLVLAAGRVAVKAGGRLVARLGAGRFIGEMGFITGRPTSAAVESLEPVRYVAWPAVALKGALARSNNLRSALQILIGQELAAKLKEGGTPWDASASS